MIAIYFLDRFYPAIYLYDYTHIIAGKYLSSGCLSEKDLSLKDKKGNVKEM